MDRVTRTELARVIGDKTLDNFDQEAVAQALAGYLLSEHKASVDLDSLMRDVMQYRLERGYIEATAVSAHDLSDEVLEDIKSLVKDHFPDSKSIVINTKTDDNLVGGVRLDFPMESLDLSVRSKLTTFKELIAKERN